jgi:autotransporter-associated beta strand protein
MESLSGAGTFDIQTSGSGAGKNIVFNSLSSFTGVLQHTQGGGSSMGFTTPTLNDTVASNIRFAGGASPAGSNNFRFIYNGSDGMTLTNRAFELAYSTGDFEIRNNGSANSAFTINSNLAVTAAGAKALRLSGTNTNGISTFAGTITNGSGTIGVTKADANTWSLTNANNTFTGTITMSSTTTSAGTLSYASAGGANPISFLQTTGSATLSYTGSTDKTMSGAITANALTTGTITLDASGSGAINYSNTASLGSAGSGNKNLILSGANTGNNTLAGAWVNNTGGVATLTKNGAGTWILTGTNTYTGATTVNAGTLLINGDNSGATGPITVAAGAYLGGSGDIGGNLSFAATSLFEIVDINTPLAVSGTVTFGSGFGIANLAGLDWDSLDLNSPYTLISTTQTFTASDIANFGLENAAPVGTGRSAYFQSGSLQLVVVPEPTTMALLGAGVALLGLHVARRRKA